MTLFSSPIVLVLVGVIGLLIGLLIGFLFIDRDSRKSKVAGVPEEFIQDGFSEIARMLYSPTKKRIVAGLDGEFFKDSKDLNSDQHARLTKVLRIWNDWNNTPAVESPSEAAAVETLEQPKPEAAVVATEAPAPESFVEKETEPEVVEPAPGDAVFSTAETASVEPVASTPFIEEPVAEEIPADIPVEEIQPVEAPVVEVNNQTIVEQINDMLQQLLPGTAYESRGLTLQDDQENGVLVFAGSEKFLGIDAVPYPDAQELIRNAVTEWERKYESEQSKPG